VVVIRATRMRLEFGDWDLGYPVTVSDAFPSLNLSFRATDIFIFPARIESTPR